MAEELRAAAVTLHAEIVKRFLSLAFLCLILVVVPELTDWLAATEAAHRDNHNSSEPQVVFKPLAPPVGCLFPTGTGFNLRYVYYLLYGSIKTCFRRFLITIFKNLDLRNYLDVDVPQCASILR